MSTIMSFGAPSMDREVRDARALFKQLAFPRDLAEWVSTSHLQSLAQQLAQRSSNSVSPVFSFRASRMVNPWRLLALWLYCTARGVCRPRAVVAFAALDARARELCGTTAPSLDELQRFREQNRGRTLSRLEELFATACLHGPTRTPFARCVEAYVSGKARAEAERRLSRDDAPASLPSHG
ncbi:MAG TPA: hypothetical protein VK530_11705 [Candidatus Acidoferrum sp.]|nr:hypothetical protein [Candidatus Acidoferrum sp.]